MLQHLLRPDVASHRNIATRFVVIIYVAHLHLNLLLYLTPLLGAMPRKCPHHCGWFGKAIMKHTTWTARHDYYKMIVSGVTRSFRSELEAYASAHLSPDEFLYGQKTGRPCPKVIALPDMHRTDGKRQMMITEFWGPPAKRPPFVYNRK